MMSDWSKTRSLASEDVGPNHMMSCPGGFSSDRDPSLDILLDPGYSDLGCAPNLGSYDSGFFPELMEDSDFTTSTRDIDAAALEQLNLGASSLEFSDDQSSSNIGHGPQETLIFRNTLFQTEGSPNIDQIDSSQYCITQQHTYFQTCPEVTNSQELGGFHVQPNVETMASEESWSKLNQLSSLPAEKSYQQLPVFSFNSTPATKPRSRKRTPRKRQSSSTRDSPSFFKSQKCGVTSFPSDISPCKVASCCNRPEKGKGIAQAIDPQEAVSLLEQSILLFSEFSQRKATALLSQLKQLIDDERLYGKPQDDVSDTGPTSVDSFSQECISDSEVVDSDCISENTSISSTPRQTNRQESAVIDAELTVHRCGAKPGVKPLFHCTFDTCNFSTRSSSDWKRHEEGEKHWPQKRFMCLECPTAQTDLLGNLICEFCLIPFLNLGANARAHYLQCASAREKNRTFARQDRLIQHLREKHRHVHINQVASAGEFGVISMWPRQCGFCGIFFESWSHRMEHIGQHYREGETISSWKLPFPRSKDFRPSGPASHRKDDDDNSSNDGFDGNNGPSTRKKSAHSSHNHKSSRIRTSSGHPSSSQSSNSRSQPASQRCTTNSDQTLQTRLLFSADTSSIPTFNANSVRGAGSLLSSLEDPILAAFVGRRWGNRASSAEHSRLRDNLENKEAKPATSEASLEADIFFALDLDGLQFPGKFLLSQELLHLQMKTLTLLELFAELRNPPSFCDANNDDSIYGDIEEFLRKGPTELQTTTDAIPWTAGTEGSWWSNSEEGTLALSPGLAYNEYYLSTRKYTKGHKKIQRKQKLFVDSRLNERTSLTLQRYLNDSEDLFVGRPDTGSERMVLAADQVLSNMTKNHSLSPQSHLIEHESQLRRRPSWGDCVVVKPLVKESPLAVQARDFIFKHRNILRDRIFWMHSNIDPGLKDSFLDISIRSIKLAGMEPPAVIRFLHTWSRNFCENLRGRSRCIGELVSSRSNLKFNDQDQTLSILHRSLGQALQGCSKKCSSDDYEKPSPEIAQPQPPTNTDPFALWKFPTTPTIYRAESEIDIAIEWNEHGLCVGKAPVPQNIVPLWDQRLDKFGRAISTFQYKPLESSQDIRLLRLQPAQESQANFASTLSFQPLDNSPSYVALSYHWGNSKDLGHSPTELNRYPTDISANPENARHSDIKPENFLWLAQGESHSLEDKGHLVDANFRPTNFRKRAPRLDVPIGHVIGPPTYHSSSHQPGRQDSSARTNQFTVNPTFYTPQYAFHTSSIASSKSTGSKHISYTTFDEWVKGASPYFSVSWEPGPPSSSALSLNDPILQYFASYTPSASPANSAMRQTAGLNTLSSSTEATRLDETGSYEEEPLELILHCPILHTYDIWSLGVTRRPGLGTENQMFLSSRAVDWRNGLHRQRPWSVGENSYLDHLVQSLGALNWARISHLLGSRSPKQCRERYHQKLKLSTIHDPISSEEVSQIECLILEIGKRWTSIAGSIQGRSDNVVKNRYNLTTEQQQRSISSPRSSPQDPNTAGDIPSSGEETRKPLPVLRFRGYLDSSTKIAEGLLDQAVSETLLDNSLPGIPGRIDEDIRRSAVLCLTDGFSKVLAGCLRSPEMWTGGNSNQRSQTSSQYFGESISEAQNCTSL